MPRTCQSATDGRILTNPPSVIANALPGVYENKQAMSILVGPDNGLSSATATSDLPTTITLGCAIHSFSGYGEVLVVVYAHGATALTNRTVHVAVYKSNGSLITSKRVASNFYYNMNYRLTVSYDGAALLFSGGGVASYGTSAPLLIIKITSPTSSGITTTVVTGFFSSSIKNTNTYPLGIVKAGNTYYLYVQEGSSSAYNGTLRIWWSTSLDAFSSSTPNSTLALPQITNSDYGYDWRVIHDKKNNKYYLFGVARQKNFYIVTSDITNGGTPSLSSPRNTTGVSLSTGRTDYINIGCPSIENGYLFIPAYWENTSNSWECGIVYGLASGASTFSVDNKVAPNGNRTGSAVFYTKGKYRFLTYLTGGNEIIAKVYSTLGSASSATEIKYIIENKEYAVTNGLSNAYGPTNPMASGEDFTVLFGLTYRNSKYSGMAFIFPNNYLDNLCTESEKAYLKTAN